VKIKQQNSWLSFAGYKIMYCIKSLFCALMCGRAQQKSHQQTIDALQTSVNNQQRVAEQQQKVIDDLTLQQSFLNIRI
jgi:hypothetical protein